jgi:hypothetical protein
MKTYRHTVTSEYGNFRADFFGQQYPFAVVYCGFKDLPEVTVRRLKEKDGILYGWARNDDHAGLLAHEALMVGALNIQVKATTIQEVPESRI